MGEKIIHLFHWPGSRSYQQYFLRILALPVGSKANLDYNIRYISRSFNQQNVNEYIGSKGIFWVSSCELVTGKPPEYDFAYPLRFFTITDVGRYNNSDVVSFEFTVGEYIVDTSPIEEISTMGRIIYKFDNDNRAPHIGEDPHLVFVSDENDYIKGLRTGNLDLKAIYLMLQKTPCMQLQKSSPEVKIAEYPFIQISDLGSYVIDKNNGLIMHDIIKQNVSLLKTQNNAIYIDFYQGSDNRNNRYKVNNVKIWGEDEPHKCIPVSRLPDGSIGINVEGEDNRISYTIPLKAKVASFRTKLIISAVLAIFFIIPFYLCYILKGQQNLSLDSFIVLETTLVTIIIPMALIAFDKIWRISDYLNFFNS